MADIILEHISFTLKGVSTLITLAINFGEDWCVNCIATPLTCNNQAEGTFELRMCGN